MLLEELKELCAKAWAPQEDERKVDKSRPMPTIIPAHDKRIKSTSE